MYVHAMPVAKENRHRLVLLQGYKGEDGKRHTRQIEDFGYTDELEKEYGKNYLERFKKIAKEKTAEEKDKGRFISVTLDKYENIMKAYDERDEVMYYKPLGYAYISKIISALTLDKFVDNRRKNLDIEYNLTNLMRLYIYKRILDPGSKLDDWKNRRQYGKNMEFALNQMYSGLQQLGKWKEPMLEMLNAKMKEKFGRKNGFAFMDGTNVYYEIEDEDGFRMHGKCKEERSLPITQIGLLLDSNAIPMSYDIYPGNTNDCTMLRPAMEKVRTKFNLKNMIYVADKGFYDGKSFADCIMNHDGYVISNSIKGTKIDANLRKKVLDRTGYHCFDEHGNEQKKYVEGETVYMYKTINDPGLLNVVDKDGKKKKVPGTGRYIIAYWSLYYSLRAKRDRQKNLEKAMEKSHTNSKSKIDNNYGSNGYLKTEVYDKDGKKVEDYKAKVKYDQTKVDEEESMDGFYLIETNLAGLGWFDDTKPFEEGEDSRWREDWGMLQLNRKLSVMDIVDIYGQLWRIEDSFRVLKSDLNIRPVYVYAKESLEGHFLICFLSLLVLRLIQRQTGYKHTMNALMDALRNFGVNKTCEGVYSATYYSKVMTDLNQSMDLHFNQRHYSDGDLKKLFGETRTQELPDAIEPCTTYAW